MERPGSAFDQSGIGKQDEPCGLTRRDFLAAGVGAGAGLLVLGLGGWGTDIKAKAAPGDLDVFKGFPRAFFYRHVEGEARSGRLSYEEWESRYLPLGGILGKVLNEAHYYTGRNNLEWFLRYKRQNPSKMVLLHYNGTGRRATDEATTRFFPGHFLYYKGTKLTRGIGRRRSEDVLHVVDTSAFRTERPGAGVSDDIAIARMDTGGKPNWETAEQVRLRGINRRNKTITVRRGKYGTRLGAFPRGSYLAAHVMTGPYRYNNTPQNNIPLWSYNFSTACPRDVQGRNCGQALAEYLGEKLKPGGELESFDGIVFDVFSWVIRFGHPISAIDVNTDGRADRGVIGGVNTVSKGALEFVKTLRQRLPDKILLADGHIPSKSQRGFGHLNGMESEGYPDKYDIHLDHLSRGENIFGFWKGNSPTPSFNYLNFRYKQDNPERWRNTFKEPNLSKDKSYRKLRLALASALFTDSVFTYSGGDLLNGGTGWLPPEVLWREGGVRVRVFDELWKGTEQKLNWLGQPLGEAVHLAEKAPDLFGGRGEKWPATFVGRFEGKGVAFSRGGAETAPMMTVRSTRPTRSLLFVLPNIEVTGKDLFVSLRLRVEPLENLPPSVPRRVEVWAIPAGKGLATANKEFSWAGEKPFSASFYFQDVGPGSVNLRFEVEGGQQVYFESLKAHSGADGRYREFEGGVVFANPSTRSFTFKVAQLLPGMRLRRIQGSDRQDPATNNGSVVGQELTLSAKNGLLVVRDET